MLTRLAKEGDLTASGVAYAVIMLPGFELAMVQIFKITRTQESALLLFFLTATGQTSLVRLSVCLTFLSVPLVYSHQFNTEYWCNLFCFFASCFCGVRGDLLPPPLCSAGLVLPGNVGRLPHPPGQDSCSLCPHQAGPEVVSHGVLS